MFWFASIFAIISYPSCLNINAVWEYIYFYEISVLFLDMYLFLNQNYIQLNQNITQFYFAFIDIV